MQDVNKHSAAYTLSIDAAKTKIMELDQWQENTNIVIDNINVERVSISRRNIYHKPLFYVGSTVSVVALLLCPWKMARFDFSGC